MRRETDFSDLFSLVWQDFQDRKNKITEYFRTCSKCGETKLIFKFSVDKRNLDGRIRVCKKRRSREYLEYYYHNRGKILIQNKEYRDSHEGHRSIYFKNYQEEHKEYLNF